MFGKVPVLVAREVVENKVVHIFRELPYKRHSLQELSEENFTNLDEVAQFLKTLLHRTSIDAIQGNAQSLLNILTQIRNIYTRICMSLSTMQEYMPRSLIRFYEKISSFQKQLAINKANYNYNNAVIAEIERMEVYMENIREKIMTFWENQPAFFLRMPPMLYWNLSPSLFLREDYFPYTMGIVELPTWLDPVVIEIMNEARKIYQTNEQTVAHREKYIKYLTLLTRSKRGVSSEIIEMIAEYMPIKIVFDLITSMSPSQFLEVDTKSETVHCRDSISVYVF